MCAQSLSCVRLFVTPWTVDHQDPLSMVLSRQEYWSGLPFPTPGDFPNPEIELTSLASPVLACGFFTTRATWEAQWVIISNSDTVILTLRFTNMPAGQGPPLAEPPRDTGMVPMERGPLTRRTSDAEVSHGSGKVAHAVPHTHTPKEVVTGVQGGWQWCRVVKVG